MPRRNDASNLPTGASSASADEDAPGERICPRCGAACDTSARICIACGTDMESGAQLKTVERAGDETDEPGGFMGFLYEWLPGLCRPVVILASLGLVFVAILLLGLSIWVFLMGAIITAVPIGAVGFMAYGQAIACIMCGQFWFLTDALVEFDSNRIMVFLVLLFAPLLLLFLLLGVFVPAPTAPPPAPVLPVFPLQ
ncbi:MAG: hypothetical protein V1918_02925 [Planctomycetota bacterium]